jgi:hypothetical protein
MTSLQQNSPRAESAEAAPESPRALAAPAPAPAVERDPPSVTRNFKALCLDSLAFDPIEREGKLYVVKLQPKITIVTPPMTLASSLVDEDGEALPFASLAPSAQFGGFLRRVEAAVLAACIAHKAEWFRRDLDDDALRSGFKTFLRPNGTVKVKVPDEVAAFDASAGAVVPGDIAAGAQVRGVLELAKISFGKTEFGAMWKLVQVREVTVPRCLIDDTGDELSDDDDDFL